MVKVKEQKKNEKTTKNKMKMMIKITLEKGQIKTSQDAHTYRADGCVLGEAEGTIGDWGGEELKLAVKYSIGNNKVP